MEKDTHTCLISGITFPFKNKDRSVGYKQGLTKALEIIQDVRLNAFNPYDLTKNHMLDAVEHDISALLFDRGLKK